MKDKYPYEVLLLGKNAPYCRDFESDLEDCESDGEMHWWEEKTPLQVIDAVKEMHDRYNEGSGWTWAEDENAKEQQKPLKILLAHAKRQYKKHFMGK